MTIAKTASVSQYLALTEYPAAIEVAELEYAQACAQERDLQFEITELDGDFEITISGDKNLKNDQERRAKRAALQKGVAYRKANLALNQARDDKATTLARLNRLRNEFTVLKLQIQGN